MKNKLLLVLALAVALIGGALVLALTQNTDLSISFSYPYELSPVPDEKDFKQIAAAAAGGDPQSQLYMGYFYVNGANVSQDFQKAAEWYRKAAEGGNARAQYYLALLYECGVGVDTDYQEAFNWYVKSIEQGDPAAHLGMAGFHFAYRKSYMPLNFGNYDVWRAKSIVLLDVKDSKPSFEECFWRLYNNDKYYQNDSEIFRVLESRWKEGDYTSSLYMAKMLLHAQGVSRDKTAALELIKQAAANKNANACIILGATYQDNRLIELKLSENQRKKYIQQSAEYSEDQYFHAYYHSSEISVRYGTPITDKFLKHLDALESLSAKGSANAAYSLARAHLLNTKNFELAYQFSQQASALNHKKAQAMQGLFEIFGIGTNQNITTGISSIKNSLDNQNIDILTTIELHISSLIRIAPQNADVVLRKLDYLSETGDGYAAMLYGMILKQLNYSYKEYFEWYLEAIRKQCWPASILAGTCILVNKDLVVNILDIYDDDSFWKQVGKLLYESEKRITVVYIPAISQDYGPAIIEVASKIRGYMNYNLYISLEKSLLIHKSWYNMKDLSHLFDSRVATFNKKTWKNSYQNWNNLHLYYREM